VKGEIMREINDEEYRNSFIENIAFPNKAEEIYNKAFYMALDYLKFETTLYWHRANYYWLFQASIYAGYFYSMTAENNKLICGNPEIIIGITCLGFLTALAWFLTNKGSRRWHGHWVNHVYKLEDGITGPLWKTTSSKSSWSVVRINELVSRLSFIAWILLGLKTIHIFWGYNIFAYTIYAFILGLITFVLLWSGKGGPYRKPKFFREGEE
jgi:hypothetical protein